MQTKLQQLAKELIECRGKLQELEERQKAEREPYELANQEIRSQLLKIMDKSGVLSTRYEDFAISRKTSKRAIVVDESKAIAFLEANLPGGILKTVHPEVLKQIERGTRLPLDGVSVQEKEYISIRANKETNAPATVGTETT
jgi:hypothetical protein